jgi:hypothetical protein
MPKTTLPSITDIRQQFAQFSFAQHEIFHWSPIDHTIYYDQTNLNTPEGIFQLLHEIGHALCGHTNYTSGVQLVKIEAEAWDRAKQLAQSYDLKISSRQIERCLDSYRDWLHLRSACPNCKTIAVETEANHYRCFNCLQHWKVPSNQTTRQYRLKLANQLLQ